MTTDEHTDDIEPDEPSLADPSTDEPTDEDEDDDVDGFMLPTLKPAGSGILDGLLLPAVKPTSVQVQRQGLRNDEPGSGGLNSNEPLLADGG